MGLFLGHWCGSRINQVCCSGPKRPQDRVEINQMKSDFLQCLQDTTDTRVCYHHIKPIVGSSMPTNCSNVYQSVLILNVIWLASHLSIIANLFWNSIFFSYWVLLLLSKLVGWAELSQLYLLSLYKWNLVMSRVNSSSATGK